MTFDVVLESGPAHGAYFSGHALEGLPDRIEVAVGGLSGPALLDLPDDELELGETVVEYERAGGVGHVCGRGRGGCRQVVTYRHRARVDEVLEAAGAG